MAEEFREKHWTNRLVPEVEWQELDRNTSSLQRKCEVFAKRASSLAFRMLLSDKPQDFQERAEKYAQVAKTILDNVSKQGWTEWLKHQSAVLAVNTETLRSDILAIVWGVPTNHGERLPELVNNVELLLSRIASLKEHGRMKRFSLAPLESIEQKVIYWDNNLVDLEEKQSSKNWNDELERGYKKIRDNLIDLEQELDEVEGKMNT